jgi:hypothetical protein
MLMSCASKCFIYYKFSNDSDGGKELEYWEWFIIFSLYLSFSSLALLLLIVFFVVSKKSNSFNLNRRI